MPEIPISFSRKCGYLHWFIRSDEKAVIEREKSD